MLKSEVRSVKALLLIVFMLIVGVICCFIMKKIQPESYKLYMVYLIFVEIAYIGITLYLNFPMK